MVSSKARISITDGHMSSHLVYASSSFFWQHLDGQQEGQQQQQHRNGHANKNITKGSAKMPI